MNNLNDESIVRCPRCGDPIRKLPASVGERPDVPITLARGDLPICAYCLVDHEQPEDEDFQDLDRIRQLLGITPETKTYVGYFNGAEIDRRFRGWQVETWSVPIDAVRTRIRHPWTRQLPRTTGPGTVIRYRLWRRGSPAHVVLWWDPRRPRLRVEPVDLDLAERAQRDEILDLLGRLTDGPPIGRPRGSGAFKNAEEFEAAVAAAVEQLSKQGRKPTQRTVAQSLSTSDRQLRAWCQHFGIKFQDMVIKATFTYS